MAMFNVRVMLLSYGVAIAVLLILAVFMSRMQKENSLETQRLNKQMKQMRMQNKLDQENWELQRRSSY